MSNVLKKLVDTYGLPDELKNRKLFDNVTIETFPIESNNTELKKENKDIINDKIDNDIGCTEEYIEKLKGKICLLKELKNTKITSFVEWFGIYHFPGCRSDSDELKKGDGLYYNAEKNILYIDDEACYEQAGTDYSHLISVVEIAAKKFGVNCEYHHGCGRELNEYDF